METTFLDILLNGILWWIIISVLFIAIIFMSTRSIIRNSIIKRSQSGNVTLSLTWGDFRF